MAPGGRVVVPNGNVGQILGAGTTRPLEGVQIPRQINRRDIVNEPFRPEGTLPPGVDRDAPHGSAVDAIAPDEELVAEDGEPLPPPVDDPRLVDEEAEGEEGYVEEPVEDPYLEE